MFERKDAPRWKKWKFYPGAVTILMPRLIFAIFCSLLLTLIVSVLLVGTDRNLPLKPGCRKSMIRASYRITVFCQALFSWFTILSHEYTDTDYKYWLGDQANSVPQNNPNNAEDKPVSMIVCNHIGFLEILSLIASPLNPAYVAKDELRTAPLISTLTKGLESLFV